MIRNGFKKIALVIALGFAVSGCAHRGPILVDFSYKRSNALHEVAKATVGVSPFKDERGKVSSVVGTRFLDINNATNELVVQGTVAEKVTSALKTALSDQDIPEKDFASWDLTEQGIPADKADVLISGEIKSFWIESTSTLANTVAKATVELRVSIADIKQKKIIRVLNVSSKIERQNVTYTNPFIAGVLSEALTGAIDQVFGDQELKSRLQQPGSQ